MRRRWVAAAVLVVAAAAAVAVAWFEPHKLFVDDRTGDLVAPAGRVLATGTFRGLEHEASGTASIIDPGRPVLHLDDLRVSNGPDLRVYLSAAPPDAPWGAFDDDFVDLGTLKGNIGDQTYAIPEGTDLSRHRTAVVWCKRFSVPFASADVKVS
ncbi:MAG TPA: DM13 domain-containing protein [Acidimicrobiales bacterium]|nr:DM13 domain-containing protein [Acidimicrobiales bacterium]